MCESNFAEMAYVRFRAAFQDEKREEKIRELAEVVETRLSSDQKREICDIFNATAKKRKIARKPLPPLSPWLIFQSDNRARFPSGREGLLAMCNAWKALSQAEKNSFVERSDTDKKRYERQLIQLEAFNDRKKASKIKQSAKGDVEVNGVAVKGVVVRVRFVGVGVGANAGANVQKEKEKDQEECAICLCSVDGESMSTNCTYCLKKIHVLCIKSWLERNASCPLCVQPWVKK